MAHHPFVEETLEMYARGVRVFASISDGNNADFSGATLDHAIFVGGTFRGATFERASLVRARFTDAALRNASFVGANLAFAYFRRCAMARVNMDGAALEGGTILDSDMTRANLSSAGLVTAQLVNTRLDGASTRESVLRETVFADIDVSPFCGVPLFHGGPSFIDARSVARSYHHPRLLRFMEDCGVAELLADSMIEGARAVGEPILRNLMRSAFISYGGPDEAFARRLYEALRSRGVTTYFFPETARVGARIANEVYARLQEHDRVILVCSRSSLDRPGVLNEIQETFDREAREGGAEYLLPIRLDDYVLTGWRDANPDLAERVARRVVADFTRAASDDTAFDDALAKVLAALKK